MQKHHDIANALTFDVEDYYQVSAFENIVDRSQWGKYESRVERNTMKILDILAEKNIQATFFVLGWVAERSKKLVQEIVSRGHELACHGYSHKLIYSQNQHEFREETFKSKAVLEEIGGMPVKGYRAASYSITSRSLWALDVLIDLGFSYDSSIFPVHHDRYGIANTPRFPYIASRPGNKSIIEFPISTLKLLNANLPIAGGGYFRIFPYSLTSYGLGRINEYEKQPFIFYLHPWEFDPEQPRIKARLLSRFRHYTNLTRCQSRFEVMLEQFSFTTVEKVLDAYHEPLQRHEYQ